METPEEYLIELKRKYIFFWFVFFALEVSLMSCFRLLLEFSPSSIFTVLIL